MILDAEATVERPARLLAEAAERDVQLAVFPEAFVPLYPSNAWAKEATSFKAGTSCGSGCGRTRWTSPGPNHRHAGRCLRAARHLLRDRRQRARVGAPGLALQRPAVDRPGRPARQAPEADADHARAALPRGRRRRRPHGHRDPGGAAWRPDLLGEPDAARPLRGLPWRAADLAGTHGRRLGRLARQHAPHRDRVRCVRRLGAAVHPGERLSERLPSAASRGQGCFRRWRRRDRRAG